MIAVKIALAVLALWYLCGIFNVAIIQAVMGDDDFRDYRRTETLWICYGPAPIISLLIIGYGLIEQPLKFGTRLGRFIGRKLEDILE